MKRNRKHIFYGFFILSLLVMLYDRPAQAGFYEIEIQPVIPEGLDAHTATCSDEYASCYMTFDLNPGGSVGNASGRYVNVVMRLERGFVEFRFLWNSQYLLVFPSGRDRFEINTANLPLQGSKVALYLANPLTKTDPHNSLVFRPAIKQVMELTISLRSTGNPDMDGKEAVPEGRTL